MRHIEINIEGIKPGAMKFSGAAWPRAGAESAKGKEALNFFRWVLENGQESARKLDFVPLPKPLVERVEAYWVKNLGAP